MAVGLPRIYGITDPVVEAAVFHGLGAVDPGPALDADWRPSLPWLVSQRLAGVALALVRDHGLELPRDVLLRLQAARRHERARTLLADLSAARVSTVMRSAGVPFVVVKGPAMAAVDPVPAGRPYLDVDIVVPPRRFDDAMAAARSAGFESNIERPARRYYERRCYEGVNLRDDSQRAIDIHHHVPPWWAGERLTLDRLLRDAHAKEIDGVEVPIAAPIWNLFIAALHLVSDQNRPGWKLLSWRDVMSTTAVCDPDEVAAVANEVRLGWWLHWILSQMPTSDSTASLLRRLDTHVDVRVPRSDRARVRALAASGERGMNLAFAARLPIPNAAAYVGGQLLPSPASRATRLDGDESLIAWWKFALGGFLGRCPASASTQSTVRQFRDEAVPQIVVGLPVFNGMPHLPEAIESIRAQTVHDFRCIVVNDGSTDGTAEYLDSLVDDRFTVIHQTNRGLVATLNTILSMCPEGSWLVRHDADDVALPDRLEILIPHMQPGVGLVHTGAAYLGSPGDRVRFRSSTISGLRAEQFVRSGRLLSVCHPSAAINSDTVKRLGGYRDISRVEDLDLWWRLALAAEIRFERRVTLRYRLTEDGVSQSALREQSLNSLYVQYALLSHLRGRNALPFDDVAPALVHLVDEEMLRFRIDIRDTQIAFQSGNRAKALLLAGKTFLRNPRGAGRRMIEGVLSSTPWATAAGIGVSPERFATLDDALWPADTSKRATQIIALPSGHRALVVSVLDAEVTLLDSSQLTREVVELAGRRERVLVSNHNLHGLALLRQNPDLEEFHRLAAFAFADGMSLIALARLKGVPASGGNRTTYLDWMPELFDAAEQHGWRLAHLGNTDETNRRATAFISARYPGVSVAHHHGYFDVKDQDANAEVLKWLRKSSPDVLLVGMSMPRKDRLIRDNWDELPDCVVLNSGGFFALLGGDERVPPRWMGRVGLEWLGRLVLSPRRTWRRYLVEPFGLMAPIAREVWDARRGR